jgi:hypothetical protein
MNPLQHRLAVVRRRLRLAVTVRGLSWIFALLFLVAAAGGLVDWRIHLPILVRALVLVGSLSAAGYLGYRYLLRPLAAKVDDLSLALRIENRYPVFNDALASAVQFLEQPAESERSGSPSLRREAVQRALGRAERIDFSPIADTGGVRAAGLSLAGSGLAALLLALLFPHHAWTAFLRLAHPYGGYDWPRQTQLAIEAKTRAARGEAFQIKATLQGVVPERAVVEYRFDGSPALKEIYEVKESADGLAGEFVAHLEPGRVQHDFRFQVRAHDAASPWRKVEVLPPPQFAPLTGRPSPQIHLQYPQYTDLPPQDLPDGVSSIEAIAGTHITLRAATDRPIVRAWLEYPPDLEPMLDVCHAFAANSVESFCPLLEAAKAYHPRTTWIHIPARLAPDGQVLTVGFAARVSGTFALHIQDELGLGNTRLVELRTVADPPPIVYLERPSRSRDSLDLLPDSEITLRVQVEDLVFAVHSACLDYRLKRGSSPSGGEETHRLPLYDHEAVGQALPQLLSGFGPSPIPVAAPPLRLRTQRLEIERRWSLADLKLKEGDVLTIQACALDFDDVTAAKKPGRSHEIEIRIVGRTALDLALNQLQAQIQQELTRLQKQQQEALEKVIPAEAHWRNKGELLPRHLDELIQAEQLQQQIRARVGSRQEGLRAEVARVLQALRDNHLPRSSTHDRMEAVASELDRLAREELDQIEPRLTEARKENEDGPAKRSAEERTKGPLPQARKHQEEVKKTLNELLKLLEPWSSTREVKGEAKSILQDQRKLAEQTENLAKDLGATLEKLSPSQKAELEKAEELQKSLAERADQLFDKLERLAADKQKQDPETAQQLQAAAAQGRGEKNNAVGKMQEAARNIRENRLAEAGSQQRASARAMEEVVKSLEDRREEELERLIKKMKEAEEKLAELAERQDRLQKKVKEAGQIADPAKREEELKRLAREQEKLQQETQEMVRELSRLRAERAGQALGQAGGRMQQANRRLDQGEDAEEQQQEALNRLNEAQQELRQAREEVEEELAREKLAKVADLIKGVKERQEALTAESVRIHWQMLQEKRWSRPLQSSLVDLVENQRALGKETEQLAKEKLDGAKVFAHLLTKAAEAMNLAADRMDDRLNPKEPADLKEGINLLSENAAEEETEHFQRAASRRIDQLLDALKPEAGLSLRPPGQGQDGQGGGQPKQKIGPTGEGDNIPPVAQLKALRALQEEVNQRTREFHKKHPDSAKLTAKERQELEAIHAEQLDVTNLFQEITAPAEMQGGQSERRALPSSELGFPGQAEPPERVKKKVRPPAQPIPTKKTEAPGAKPASPKKAEQPGKEDEPGDEAEVEAQAVEEKIKELMDRLGRNLREAESRLTHKDPGDATQEVQRDVVKDLNELIEQTKRRQQQQQQSSSSASSQQQKSQQARGRGRQNQSAARRPQPSPTSQTQKGTTRGGTSPRGEMSKIADLYKDIWGHLPETMRQEMNQYSREQFMEKYNELLKQYYATIAEKGRRKGE